MLHAALWYSKVCLKLIDYICKSIQLGNWFGLHDNSKSLVDDLWLISAWEEDLVKLTCKQCAECFELITDCLIRALWDLREDPARGRAPEELHLSIGLSFCEVVVLNDT